MAARDSQGIEVEFFASLREAAGCQRLEIPASECERLCNVDDVRAWAARQLGETSRGALFSETLRAAVNDEFADMTARVEYGDRIAFMPVVTGG